MVRALLALLIFGLLFNAIGRDNIGQAFSRTDWRWLPPLYLVAACGIFANTLMLHYLLRRAGLAVRIPRVLLAKSLGSFYSLILPGDFFAGAAKWADLSAATGNKAGVLSSMLLAKLALAVPPLLVGSVALAAAGPLRNTSLAPIVAVAAVLLISVATLALFPWTGRRLDEWIRRRLNGMPPRLSRAGDRLLVSIAVFRQLQPADYAIVFSLSFAVFALAILGMYLATIAMSVSLPVTALFWVNLILFVTRLLPLTVGNLGVREGILVLAFGLYGVPAAAAVLIGLLMFSTQAFVGLLGGAYQLALATGLVAWRSPQGRQRQPGDGPPGRG